MTGDNKSRCKVAPKQFAHKHADYIYAYALSNKELKSLAQTIQYHLSFFSPFKTIKLRSELGFLYAFLGTLTLKKCSEAFPEIHIDIINKISKLYVDKLLHLIPNRNYSDYQKRLNVWEKLFTNFEDSDDYEKSISVLAATFYEFLTDTPCDESKKLMLIMRFNGYMENFIIGFNDSMKDL